MDILLSEAMRAVTHISHHAPAVLKKHLIPGAFITYMEGPWGRILSQEMKANGYTAWYYLYFITLPVLFHLVSDTLLAALHYRPRMGKYRLYGLRPGVLKEVRFEPGEYRSLHIGLPLEKLDQLSAQYPPMGELLHDLKDGTKVPVLHPLFHIHKKAALIIRDILGCREDGEKENLYLHERVVRLFNLYLEDLDVYARIQQRINRKMVQFGELKAFVLECLQGRDYIPGDPLSSKNLAGRLGMSERELARAIRQQYHTNLPGFILKTRMERAIALVRDPAIPIGDIVITLGYRDFSSFTRAFAKYHGHPPSYFRYAK
ncbi:MAG TPA: helix-turn-helix transcriptional regulator [Chitinophagaceae bacterium]